MSAEELFKNLQKDDWRSTLYQLKKLFFSNKTEEILGKYNRVQLSWEQGKCVCDNFVANLAQVLPEAELICNEHSRLNEPKWIKLKNIDFEIQPPHFNGDYCSFTYLHFYKLNDIADLMREINNSVPKWETEFQAFCTDNQQKINDFEKKRLMQRYDKQRITKEYLLSRINDALCMHRMLLPNMWDSVRKTLKDNYALAKGSCYLLNNISIKYNRDDYFDPSSKLEISVRNFENTSCNTKLYPAEVYLEIDRQIPQWIEEGKELEREFDKQEKIKQINENSTKVLVKNKMRELGCEYKFNPKEQDYRYQQSKKPIEYVLEVKLQKGRKLVVTIPSNNLNRVRKTLDSLEASINAINSVPMNHRIKFQFVGNEAWTKE